MNPQEQGEQARRVARNVITFYSNPRKFSPAIQESELVHLAQSYLTLSTQLSQLQSENARLVETLQLLQDHMPGCSCRTDSNCMDTYGLIKAALSPGAGDKCKHLKEEWDHEHQVANHGLYCTCGKKLSGEKEGQ